MNIMQVAIIFLPDLWTEKRCDAAVAVTDILSADAYISPLPPCFDADGDCGQFGNNRSWTGTAYEDQRYLRNHRGRRNHGKEEGDDGAGSFQLPLTDHGDSATLWQSALSGSVLPDAAERKMDRCLGSGRLRICAVLQLKQTKTGEAVHYWMETGSHLMALSSWSMALTD